MAYSGWTIRLGANRPKTCPEPLWWKVLAILAASPKATVLVHLIDGEWSHTIVSGDSIQVDEHSGPHLLLAEDDTSQSF